MTSRATDAAARNDCLACPAADCCRLGINASEEQAQITGGNMPEVIHVFSEQDSRASLFAEVHRLQSSLAAMRQARDFHGANSAYLMRERDRLQKEIEMRDGINNGPSEI